MSQYESQFEENLYQLRRDKLTQIAELVRAANPALTEAEARYPNAFAFTHTLPELRALGDHLSTEDLAEMHIEAAIAGRLIAIRVQGKAGFATLQQGGARLQIYVRKDDVGATAEQSEALFNLYKLLDLGDHIGVRGYLMRTRTGELTLHAAPMTSTGSETPAVHAAPAVSAVPVVSAAPASVVPVRPALTLLTKAMLPLPDKYSGLGDIELRYRRRYLDLFTDTGDTPEHPSSDTASQPSTLTNPVILSEARSAQSKDPENTNPAAAAAPLSTTNPAPLSGALARLPAREVFEKRAKILRSIRHFFDTRGYLEVETPMLHTIAGGAAARPFKTHHNALDIPLSLRIAPELYLKRLVVGGLDRVYEINRNFRNEGVSTQHNPEFTMLEFYQAYANYHDLMDLTQELITQVAQEVNGTTLTNFNGTEIDLSKWTKLSMREAIIKFWPDDMTTPPAMDDFASCDSFSKVAYKLELWSLREINGTLPVDPLLNSRRVLFNKICARLCRAAETTTFVEHKDGLIIGRHRNTTDLNGMTLGKSIAEVFELLAEAHLIQPTIIYDFPLAVSPLSKIKPNEPNWVERFEFYIGGFEVGNAFSELNDPDDQRNRFLDQLKERDRGDDEAHAMDEDYVRALGYGLPPTAGEGIGIDRLTMILTGSRSIRDVILFPLMRPQPQTSTGSEELHTHGASAE